MRFSAPTAWRTRNAKSVPMRGFWHSIRPSLRESDPMRLCQTEPFSLERRRAVVEAAFNGLSAAWRYRFELHYRRSQDPRLFGASHRADRQLPPERRRSHLVSHLTPDSGVEIENVKVRLSWSPVTESNRRPSPYHGHPIVFLPATNQARTISQLQLRVLKGLGVPRGGWQSSPLIVPTAG
jgi:hypothetical protein